MGENSTASEDIMQKLGASLDANAVCCDNVLQISIGIGPVRGSRGYQVAKIDCKRLPFLEDQVLESVRSYVEPTAEKLRDIVSRVIVNKVADLGLKVKVDVESRDDPNNIPEEDEEYTSDTCFNLYVDMGSTNCKWMAVPCDEKGLPFSALSGDIPPYGPTKKLCAEWGVIYDKAFAYSLKTADFEIWLRNAVVAFVRKAQKMRQEHAFNVYWAFPRLVRLSGDAEMEIEFDRLNRVVGVELARYHLRGKFFLVPEAESLNHMFYDRVMDWVEDCAAEAEENRNRDVLQSEAEAKNKDEQAKASLSKFIKEQVEERNREAREQWADVHWIKSFFGINRAAQEKVPDLYQAKTYTFNSERLKDYEGIDSVGVASRSTPCNLLFLDAGGSTLDFCFVPANGNAKDCVSGSYRAGGADVTDRLVPLLGVTFDGDEDGAKARANAEKRKLNLSSSENPKMMEATRSVYLEALKAIRDKIKAPFDRLCVVCSGLASSNRCLLNLVSEVLGLPAGQQIVTSDLLLKFPESHYEQFPAFKHFAHIVRGGVERGQASPAFDVIGGLYFYSLKGAS